MKIQVKSDMHDEINTYRTLGKIEDPSNAWYLHPEADILVLAGDIITANDDEQLEDLAERLFEFAKPVIYVPGNHEYWGSSLPDVTQRFIDMFEGTNVKTIETDSPVAFSFDHMGVRFIGATVWSEIDKVDKATLDRWPDFKCIKGFTPSDYKYRHARELNSIWTQMNTDIPTVVVTHHTPGTMSLDPVHRGNGFDNFYYFEDALSDLFFQRPNLRYWIHGHTHCSHDYERGVRGGRVICNPRGHKRDGPNCNKDFKNDLLIEVK